jgi:hypothetical protein
MRHLSKPKHYARKFRNPFLTVYKHALRHEYFCAYTQEWEEAWRQGKSGSKLRNIDESRRLDQPAPNRGKSFVKFEISCKAPTKARLIQANHNECTAYEFPEEYRAVTRAVKAVASQPIIIEGITFELHYAGGHDHESLSKLFTQFILECPGKYYIDERDGKNWDSTMQKETLLAELDVYKMLKMKAADRFGARCAENRAFISCKKGIERILIRYISSWKRLSGDWNTSLGNTLISMMVCVHAITNLPAHLKPARVRALFMGDDYLGVYYHKELPCPKDLSRALDAGEQQMGITPARGLFDDPLHVTFISLSVWPTFDGTYQFVPQPAKQLCKLFWSAKRLHTSQVRGYSTDIAKCLWATYQGFPLMMQFLKAHYHPNERCSVKWDHYFADQLLTRVANVDWQSGFVYKYGIPYSATFFELPKVDGAVLQHPVVNAMLEIELMDPMDRKACLSRLR